MTETWLPWRPAWDRALYGAQGFYRTNQPAEHFRTSVHTSHLFATAVLALAKRIGVHRIVDFAAGGGELLGELRKLDEEIDLVGVELRGRPPQLARDITWWTESPSTLTGLVVANEWLDNVPCEVVEVDENGEERLVEVCVETGAERLAGPVSNQLAGWLDEWWPINRPGERAEVGLARDNAWAALCSVVHNGMALAVDYTHDKGTRPSGGTLTGYREGRQVHPVPDGSSDITAHVAIDSVTSRCPAVTWVSQREALAELGLSARRPPLALASSDPSRYVRQLSAASEAAELMRQPGLGDFSWLMCPA